MATIEITPIPYNGGTINLTSRKDMTVVHMGAGKFVLFYGQSSPNMIFAHVINVSNANSTNPTAVNGPQFAFTSNGSRVRAWKMAANRLCVLMGNDLKVIEIDGSDNLTQRGGQIANFFTISLWRGTGSNEEEANNITGGSNLCGGNLADNVMLFYRRSGSTTQGEYATTRVTYNPTTDTFAEANIGSASFSVPGGVTTNLGYQYHIQDIPNSTNKMVYAQRHSSGTATRASQTPSCQYAYVINNTGLMVRILQTANMNDTAQYTANAAGFFPIHYIFPRSESEFIGFKDGRTLQVHTGTVPFTAQQTPSTANRTGAWSPSPVVFSPTGGNSMVHHAVMLDDNHFAMVMSDSIDPTAVSSSSTAANSRTAQQYLRIVRYVDKNFSVVSTDTENYLGNPLGAPLNPDQEPMIWSLGGGAYAFVSKSDTTAGNVQLNIRTIY